MGTDVFCEKLFPSFHPAGDSSDRECFTGADSQFAKKQDHDLAGYNWLGNLAHWIYFLTVWRLAARPLFER